METGTVHFSVWTAAEWDAYLRLVEGELQLTQFTPCTSVNARVPNGGHFSGNELIAKHLKRIHNFPNSVSQSTVNHAMAWYLNKYECAECGTGWEDEWSCMCDDECPSCHSFDFSPVESDDISAFTEIDRDGHFHIYYSPPRAGHEPDYKLLAVVPNKNLATVLEKLAFELAKPL